MKFLANALHWAPALLVTAVLLCLFFVAELPAMATPNPPAISPGYGIFATQATVSISGDSGATFYYTIDGSTPVAGVSPVYSTPFNLTTNTTVKSIAVIGGQSSSVSSAYLAFDPNVSHVRSTGMSLWLRSDYQLSSSSGKVTSWQDLASGNFVTQSNSANQPSLVSNAVNSLPSVSFNGSSSFLNLPNNFDGFRNPIYFVVFKPSSSPFTANARILEVGTGSSSNAVYLSQPTTTSMTLGVNQFSSPNTLSSSSTAITPNQYQIFEATQPTFETVNILTNGVQNTTGSLPTAYFATRTGCFLGTDYSNTLFFSGEIAEILVYNGTMTANDVHGVEGYLMNRYAIVGPPPTIAPKSAVFPNTGGGTFIQVPLMLPITLYTPDYNATMRYTLDGSTPGPTSQLYSAPFLVDNSCVVKAIAIRSYGNSGVSLPAYIQLDTKALSSLVATDGLVLWLKSDYGLISSGGKVSRWVDMSGNSNDATQSNVTNQPAVSVVQQNGFPVLTFNGSSQYLQLPAGFTTFGNGLTALVAVNPNASGSGEMIEVGNGSSGDNIVLSNSTTTASLSTARGTTSSTLTAPSALSPGRFQLLEGTQDGNTAGSIKVNSVISSSGTLNYASNTLRSQNTVGARYDGAANFFNGSIAEILLYNRPLTAAELSSAEAYMMSKYQIGLVTPPAPTITTPAGTYGAPFQIQISAPSDCTIYVTTDGSTPNPSTSMVYSSPMQINYSQTVQAIAVRAGVSSSVASAAYTLNATQWPAPQSSDTTPPTIQIKLPTQSVP